MGLQVIDKNGQIEESLKLRGIRLNFKASESLSYTQFRVRVLRWARNEGECREPILLEYRRLRPAKHGSVYTMCQSIGYNPNCQKGITQQPDLTIVPFGWCE